MNDVAFVCTGQGGRGTHDIAIPQEQEQEWQPGQRRQRYPIQQLACPACGREVRIGYHVMQKLTAAGLQQVDISLLPF